MGIDIGTSGCKAVLFDEKGALKASAFREYHVISVKAGWAELDSDEVMAKCFEVIRETAGYAGTHRVKGLGISSQGEAFTLVDRDGKALTNAFVSSDARAVDYVQSWPCSFGMEKLYHITGHTPHPMFSLFKLLWVRDEMAEQWKKTEKILCFEDLLQYRLGITEAAMGWPLAGRTMLFDVINHCWDKEIIENLGIGEEQLSRPLPSGMIAGRVNGTIARALHLSESTFVVTGGHDQPCSALGAGAFRSGVAVYASGTVDCITAAFDTPIFTPELQKSNLCTYDHAAPAKYATVAFSLTGGNILQWFKQQFGRAEIEEAAKLQRSPYERLIERMPKQPTRLLVLPYFTPSGTPYFDTRTKGAILGLDLSTTREEIMKALLEGVALEMRLNLEILEKAGYAVEELRAIGGGAQSRVWNQLRADILRKPITVTGITEAGCMGAAMLAAAAGSHGDVMRIADQWIQSCYVLEPATPDRYEKKFSEYKKLYKTIAAIDPDQILPL